MTVRWIPAILLLGACTSSWKALDADGDGFTTAGGDCWDDAPGPAGTPLSGADIHPGAAEAWYDGIDADCAGDDDFDADGDGFVPTGDAGQQTLGVASSGNLPDGDCWDDPDVAVDPLNGFDAPEAFDVHPSAAESWYDGIDADCAGDDDFDQDGDGFDSAWYERADGALGDDCFDAPDDAFTNGAALAPDAVFPGASETWYDGTDQNCDGNEYDQDGDGYVLDEECNDLDPLVFPNDEIEIWYNCVDENCDGADGDRDRDGYVTDDPAYTKSCDWTATNPGKMAGDCWDDPTSTPPEMTALAGFPQPASDETHPAATDTWYDAVDQDCDAQSDFDRDGDGEASLYYPNRGDDVGPDCFDAASDVADFGFVNGASLTPAAVNSSASEIWYDGTDQDCDGNEYDQDGDGHDADAFGGLDCDDADAAISPDAVEMVADGIDADCDAHELCFDDDDDDGALDSSGDTRASADLDCTDANEGGLATATTDCDDTRASVHVGAAETIDDARDEDCDGEELCYDDADDDGYLDGAGGVRVSSDLDCTDAQEGQATTPTTDCDDASAGDHPGATETVDNGDDEDCDGNETCFVDADADGYRPDSTTTTLSGDFLCTGAGEGATADPSGDCDDGDATVHPGLDDDDARLGIDDDCDGYVDEASTVYGDVILTELTIKVTGTGTANEWFEIYNQSGRDLWLDGWEIRQGADRFCISPDLGTWPDDTYLVFCAQAPTGVTCDYTYNSNTMSDFDGCSADDSPGDINLSEPGDSVTLDLDGTTIDDVAWDAGWTLSSNVSLMLQTAFYDADDNDDPAHWCDGVDTYTSGHTGSPGYESNCP